MESEKSEIKKNLDKLHKIRFGNDLNKISVDGKGKTNYFELLIRVLKTSIMGYLPASVKECDVCLLMNSSSKEESTTYKYERTFKFLCDTNHPMLEGIWKSLDISKNEAEQVVELAKKLDVEKLEAFFLFKDAKKHDNLDSFGPSTIRETIRKIAADSQNGTVVSHPVKMSHPACKLPRIFADGFNYSADGLIRSGNTEARFDLHINATQLKVYKFLALKINGVFLYEHIKGGRSDLLSETFGLSIEFFDEVLELFRPCFIPQTQSTSRFLKQVYFPIDDKLYHQLSLLTPASIVFNLKEKIDWLNNVSPQTFAGKKARKNNDFAHYSYSTISDLTVTKHGGDHPKNISGLNNKYQSYYLLSSLPPELKPREVRLPVTDFFKDSFTAWQAKEVLESLHRLFVIEHSNINIREGIEYRIQQFVDLVIEKMWQIRLFLIDNPSVSTNELSQNQKIWLYPQFKEQREREDDWLDSVTRDIARGLIHHYRKNKFIVEPVLLADQELLAIERIIEDNRELLR